jgi:nucleoside-diphosphate-sugar epimerase
MPDREELLLITGTTGTTGDPTVRLLLDRGHRVRAVVHRVDARSERLPAAGAEIVLMDATVGPDRCAEGAFDSLEYHRLFTARCIVP